MQKFEELEKEYAKYIGVNHCITTNTGTSALHLALKSIGIKEGDEVITCNYEMIAPAFAISYCGAKPIFVDCTDDLLIDASKIKRRITTKTKAILVVHTYGRVADLDEIMRIATKYKLRVINDCAEAQGAVWKGKSIGSYDIGVYSFYINKIIPAEEGGCITTNDEAVARRARYLKNMSFNEAHDFLHDEIGYNYRMPNAEANYALANLSTINLIQQKRYQVKSWYDKYLKKEYQMPDNRSVIWVYDIQHPQKDKVIKLLNDKGIQARHGFKPMTQQKPYFSKSYASSNAYKWSQKVMYLPVSPLMTEEMCIDICKLVNEVL